MLFAPPRTIETTVFARLPDELKLKPGQKNEWADGQPLGTPARSLLEGPSFDRDGNFYCVDIVTGRIYRVSREGSFHIVAEYDGWPNGLKIHKDGRIFVADYKNGIMLLDPVNGKVTPYLVRANLERFKAVNDLFFASNGDLYFTDQGLTGLHDPTGRVFRVRPNGEVSCLLDNVPSPNGLVMNKDETALYVAVTRGNCIWRVPFTRGGGVAKVGMFIQLSGGGGPDGLALDDEGRLAIAHVAMGSVWVFDRIGEPVYRIRSCMGTHTTNVAFGWPDRKTLYITESESGTILRAELDVPGKAMYSHA
ncbi:MAG TPA: SMP-30/gluconolactonase/LRE family protein [Burkholderiales bacterium]|nr:SMP-30/gluconolactonase/LRE family protein [Burkholderiales bacterium]